MKRVLFCCCFIAVCSMVFTACDKSDSDNVSGVVELYLLESYETIESSCQIEKSSVVTKENPLIKYSDFESYNTDEYVFKISSGAKDDIKNLEHSVHGLPFAVTANEELIYTGYFWPGYSSAICDWFVIDPLFIDLSGNQMRVELGYPGLMEDWEISDERNNKLILDIFKRDGKLIE